MIQNTPNPAYYKYNTSYGAISPEQQAAIKSSINQTTADNAAVKTADDAMSDPRVLAGAVGIWGLLRLAIMPINKAISKGLFGKIGDFGDKVSDFLHLGRVSSATNGVKNWAKDKRLFKYFTSTYKTEPKSNIASSMGKGTAGEVAMDTTQFFEACEREGIDLKDYFHIKDASKNMVSMSREEIDKIIKNPFENKETKDKILKALEKLEKNIPEKSIKFGGKFKIPFTNIKLPIPGFSRTVGFRELANKIKTVTGEGATTGLGKSLAKGTLRTLEGLTNGMAGGPGAMFIQAFCFAQAAKAAIDAPKGEKLKTFMENVFQDLGFYLTGSLAVNLMHRAGGNKFRGMTEKTKKLYLDTIADANKKAVAGTIDKEGLEAAKKEAKLLLKGVSEDAITTYKNDINKAMASNLDKNALKVAKKAAEKEALKTANVKFWERPLKFAGKVLSWGLHKFEPIIGENDNRILKFFKKFGSKCKGFPGGLGRLVLALFVISPVLVKPIVKLSHLIFGRPTKSVLDKDTDTKKKTETAPVENQTAQQGTTNYLDKYPNQNQTNPQGSTNYLDQYSKQNQTNPVQTSAQVPAAVNASSPIADDAIAAKKIKKEENAETTNSSEPERTYVPSSTPTVHPESPDDTSKVDELLKKADSVEASVMKSL